RRFLNQLRKGKNDAHTEISLLAAMQRQSEKSDAILDRLSTAFQQFAASPLGASPARSTSSSTQSVSDARLHHQAKTFTAAVSKPLTRYQDVLDWRDELQQVARDARSSGIIASYADIIPLLGDRQFGPPFINWIIDNRKRYLHLGDAALETCLRDFEKENFVNVDQRTQKSQLTQRRKPAALTFDAFLSDIMRLGKSLPAGTSLSNMELKEILFNNRPPGHIPSIVTGDLPTHWTSDNVTPRMFAMYLDAAATENTGTDSILQQFSQRFSSVEKILRDLQRDRDRTSRRATRDSSHSLDEEHDEAYATTAAETSRPPGYPSNVGYPSSPGYPSAPRAPSPGRAITGCYICGSVKHSYKQCPYQGLLVGLSDDEMESAREVLKKHFR
ncbi:hypothetical protein HK102_011985, partial [Quaeritorhiza haematococci]